MEIYEGCCKKISKIFVREVMAKCAICDKNINFGNQLSITRSHISKRSTRTFKPNLRTVKAIVDGQPKRITVCAISDGSLKAEEICLSLY